MAVVARLCQGGPNLAQKSQSQSLDGECQHKNTSGWSLGLWGALGRAPQGCSHSQGRAGLSSLLLAKLPELPLSHIYINIISPVLNLLFKIFFPCISMPVTEQFGLSEWRNRTPFPSGLELLSLPLSAEAGAVPGLTRQAEGKAEMCLWNRWICSRELQICYPSRSQALDSLSRGSPEAESHGSPLAQPEAVFSQIKGSAFGSPGAAGGSSRVSPYPWQPLPHPKVSRDEFFPAFLAHWAQLRLGTIIITPRQPWRTALHHPS